MKYFLTLLLCLAVAGLAFAGNTATVKQTGDDLVGTVSQSGDLNTATIDQINNNSSSTQSQNGERNTAKAAQYWDYYGHSNNSIQQTQIGKDNFAYIYQKGAEYKGIQYQNGEGHSATITQYRPRAGYAEQIQNSGNKNEAIITQAGKGRAGRDAYAKQEQYGSNNYANTYQTGPHVEPGHGNNRATIYQEGDENSAEQNQNGLDNTAAAVQNGEGNTAEIDQIGDNNVAKLNQSGGGISNILQNGSSNRVEGYDVSDTDPTTISGDEWAKFSGTDMDVNQQNDGNVAEVDASGTVDIDQDGHDHAVATGSGNIVIYQKTDDNQAMVIRDAGTSIVVQEGNDYNLVWLDKEDSEGDVDIYQKGDHNEVFGLTSSPSWAIFTGDDGDPLTLDLDVDQVGSYNLLRLDANGQVTVNQNGDSNTAYVSQQ